MGLGWGGGVVSRLVSWWGGVGWRGCITPRQVVLEKLWVKVQGLGGGIG